MKLSFSKMIVILSMGMGTYCYLKMHPDTICQIKKAGRDATRKMYQMLEEDN